MRTERLLLLFLPSMVTAFGVIPDQSNTNANNDFGRVEVGAHQVIICEEHFHSNENLANITHFCVHGVPCKERFWETPDEPCECPSDRSGKHCEFDRPNVSCDLNCQNGGNCQLGLQTLEHAGEYTKNASIVEPHCQCTSGFSGDLCEIDANDAEESRSSSISSLPPAECGPYQCMHGGTCVQQPIAGTNLMAFHCDCTTAIGDDGITKYAGRFCQAPSTQHCSNDHNGYQFCVNGGTCRDESHLGCSCPPDFVGPVCEFAKVEMPETEPCLLQCENNGVCRKGAKDTSRMDRFNDIVNRTLRYNDDFEHCVCPKGFVGLRCETRMDVCPGVNHVCLHGGVCKGMNDGTGFSFGCNCQPADTTTSMFGGEYCEYESTELCTVNGLVPQGETGRAFCVNNGECQGFANHGEL